VSQEPAVSRESRPDAWGERHARPRMRFVPAGGMRQQVVRAALAAVQTSAAVRRVDTGVSPKLPWAGRDGFHWRSLNYSRM